MQTIAAPPETGQKVVLPKTVSAPIENLVPDRISTIWKKKWQSVLGSGQRYQILSLLFARCAGQKTRETRVILACQCVF